MNQVVFEAYGYRLGYRWCGDWGAEVVAEVVLPNWVQMPSDSDPDSWLSFDEQLCVYDNGSLWTRASDRENLRHRLQQLTQLVLTENSREMIFLHAGVVWRPDGVTVVPGTSKSGKTTLVTALLQDGARFFSDEFAVIDSCGRVHAYPRARWTRVSRRQRVATPATDLGWLPELPPSPIHSVLLTWYVPGAHWQPAALTLEQARQGCLAQLQGPQRQRAEQYLGRALEGAHCWAGCRGEAHEVLAWLKA